MQFGRIAFESGEFDLTLLLCLGCVSKCMFSAWIAFESGEFDLTLLLCLGCVSKCMFSA